MSIELRMVWNGLRRPYSWMWVFKVLAIILGGGVCAQGDNLIKPIQKIVDRDIFAGELGPKCEVRIATLGNSAGILGAVALVMNK